MSHDHEELNQAMAQAAQDIQDPAVRAAAAQQLGMTEAFLMHALTPQNVGMLPNPDGFASPKGSCGDFIELYLTIRDDKIKDARYMTEGCAHTVACGSALTSMVRGLPIKEAAAVGAQEIEQELGGLPRDHRHCAALAAATLRAALRDHYKKQKQPWIKAYGDR